MQQRVNTLSAECRALEFGHYARLQADGSFLVCSENERPGRSWRVTYEGRPLVSGRVLLHCSCECPSGENRRDPIPCLHSALVARRLERDGYVSWDAGLWYLTSRALEATEAAKRLKAAALRPELELWGPRDPDACAGCHKAPRLTADGSRCGRCGTPTKGDRT